MIGGWEARVVWVLQQGRELATDLLDPLLSVFTSALVIVVGGLLSWRVQRWWTKPVLEAGDSGIIPWRPHNFGNTDVYRVPIENTGRRAAKNCKAQMFVTFESETTRYEIESSLPWAGEEGIHTTINPGEVSYFNLFSHDGANNMMSVPSTDNLVDEGLILRYPLGDNHENPSPVISTKVNAETFANGEVGQMLFKVTSENCSAITRKFRVGSDGTPQLVDSMSE